ncbi:hypothetical protein OIV83_005061 [Microbotryomycetes sp. JL201]|nr:hypothetical protein OIV83_005061 [Microbotryomycetes sp. JL201]
MQKSLSHYAVAEELVRAVSQPAIVSLFSSTSSHPLSLASHVFTSTDLVQDSFISILNDATDGKERLIAWKGASTSNDANSEDRVIRFKGSLSGASQNISSRVLHVQAPNVKSTGVRFGSTTDLSKSLGITLPWLHLSVKDVGQLFYFEVTVLDDRGERVCFRISTFQTQAKVYPPPSASSKPTLVHLPLRFPDDTNHRLTPWSVISLDLPLLLFNAQNIPHQPGLNGQGRKRFGKFASLLSVEVHANCRLRRIWCTLDPGLPDDGMILRGWQTELGLFAASATERTEG